MVTCDEKIKVLSSQHVLRWIFLKIRYLIWRYAELNCLFLGSGQIPLNIELKQDDYTACCIHTVVRYNTPHCISPLNGEAEVKCAVPKALITVHTSHWKLHTGHWKLHPSYLKLDTAH